MLIVVLSATIVTFLGVSIFVKRYYRNYTEDENVETESLNQDLEIEDKKVEKNSSCL